MTASPPESFRFDDGAAYERFMGRWSQRTAVEFLDWLRPAREWRWLDVGCGNGAFTEMIVDRCAPASVDGIDPSEGQLAYARTRPALAGVASFQQASAMSLPFSDDRFDVAVMPLVIVFVPEPPVAVAEMARVVRRGGVVASYIWDLDGRGFPYQAFVDELRALGVPVPDAPSNDASRLDAMESLWRDAGLEGVESRVIRVERTYENFDDYWATILDAPNVGRSLPSLSEDRRRELMARLRARLPGDERGRITVQAHANAVRGTVAR